MACPVTLGFFYALEHSGEGKERNTSFEFVTDAEGTLPELRAAAAQEPLLPDSVYYERGKYTVALVTVAMAKKAPNIIKPIQEVQDLDGMRVVAIEVLDDLADRLTISKMKRKVGGDVASRVSEFLIVHRALEAFVIQLASLTTKDFKSVGMAANSALVSLSIPPDFVLKSARKIFGIKDVHG
jgi:hypothetical protein